MALEIKRLHLASVTPPGTRAQWPVHGFVVSYPGGAALVDTGVGGPQGLQDDWRVVNVAAAEALAGLDMSPADITMVINTHLHFDRTARLLAVDRAVPRHRIRRDAPQHHGRRRAAGRPAGARGGARGTLTVSRTRRPS